MLFEQINRDILNARLKKDSQALTILSTLKSEIQRSQKNLSITPTDDEVISVVKKLIFSIDENLKKVTEQNAVLLNEKNILLSYLPKQLTDEEILKIAESVVNDGSCKVIGEFMKYMKLKYSGLYDGASASKIFNSIKK